MRNKLCYAVPAIIVLISGLILLPIKSYEENSIPSWVNNVANFWINGNISDQEFENCISFLLDNRVLDENIIKSLRDKIRDLKQITLQQRANLWESTINPSPLYEYVEIKLGISEYSYMEGDTIVISGSVDKIINDTTATLQVFHEGNLVDNAQITVAKDGKFTHTMLAKGPLWQKDGKYIVRASYGVNNIIEKGFEFFTKPSGLETSDIFEVKAGAKGTFDVDYTIRGAMVKDMAINHDDLKLVVIIETKNDGYITIDLPRYAIDAKKSDGTDDSFIVIIDGVEVPYKEISTNVDSRIIEIKFENGDSGIEIFGTFVL